MLDIWYTQEALIIPIVEILYRIVTMIITFNNDVILINDKVFNRWWPVSHRVQIHFTFRNNFTYSAFILQKVQINGQMSLITKTGVVLVGVFHHVRAYTVTVSYLSLSKSMLSPSNSKKSLHQLSHSWLVNFFCTFNIQSHIIVSNRRRRADVICKLSVFVYV